jgi:hypothetical protein
VKDSKLVIVRRTRKFSLLPFRVVLLGHRVLLEYKDQLEQRELQEIRVLPGQSDLLDLWGHKVLSD